MKYYKEASMGPILKQQCNPNQRQAFLEKVDNFISCILNKNKASIVLDQIISLKSPRDGVVLLKYYWQASMDVLLKQECNPNQR